MILHIGTLLLDHAHVAIFDWIIFSKYAKFWAPEWSQHTKHDYVLILVLPSQLPVAFTSMDFEFLDK